MKPIDRALDDIARSMDSATELRRPENKVSHAFMVFLDACKEMRRVLINEDTRRLAAMEERDGEEIVIAMRSVERARICALWRLDLENTARGR